MSQSAQKKTAAIAETTMTTLQAGRMTPDQIRKTAALYMKKGIETIFGLTTDELLSISQKTVLMLPELNKREMSIQIVSINQAQHKGTAIPVVTYVGSMTSEANKLVSMLAPVCASIRGGYFPGYATLSETKTQISGITVPSHFRNMIVLNKKNTLLFSVGNTLQEISVADALKENWNAAKVVTQLNSEILFIGRPSESEKNVFVVTERSILTVSIENYKAWKEFKAQPASIAQKTLAFFKEGKSYVSVLNNGALEVTPVAA